MEDVEDMGSYGVIMGHMMSYGDIWGLYVGQHHSYYVLMCIVLYCIVVAVKSSQTFFFILF